jgi:putative ABC transport system permease protein
MLDRVGIAALLSPASRMIVRNLTKRPLRSGLASAGMALAVAIIVLGTALTNGTDRMRDVQYQAAQREDISVTLAHPRGLGTVSDFLALPGVTRAEPFRVVPARLLVRGGHEDIALCGLAEGSVLRRVVDNDYNRVRIAGSRVVLTAWTARKLALAPGDRVAIEIREGRRRVVTVELAGIVDEPLGQSGYMELAALGRLLGEPGTYSAVNLTIDRAHEHELYAALKRLPQAASIGLRRGTVEEYRAMSDSAIGFVRAIEIVFAVIIAFGVVYNTARIALAERGRELATLRVLGFTRGEASRILLGEIAILAAPAIPLGLVLGYGLAGAVVRSMSGSLMHIPVLVFTSTYVFAALVFVLAALVSALIVRRRIDRLDLVGILKARE